MCACCVLLKMLSLYIGLRSHNSHITSYVYFVLFCSPALLRFTKDTHQYFTKPSPVQVGDYIEFIAEIDLLVSASTCPQGDVSIACGSTEEPKVYPLSVEVYEIDSTLLKEYGWRPSPSNGYTGNHGI
jgi:hypothetical protein